MRAHEFLKEGPGSNIHKNQIKSDMREPDLKDSLKSIDSENPFIDDERKTAARRKRDACLGIDQHHDNVDTD